MPTKKKGSAVTEVSEHQEDPVSKEYIGQQEIKALFLRTESLRRDVDRIDMTLREILEHLRRSFPSTFRRVGA